LNDEHDAHLLTMKEVDQLSLENKSLKKRLAVVKAQAQKRLTLLLCSCVDTFFSGGFLFIFWISSVWRGKY
jgi:hypothetical protein